MRRPACALAAALFFIFTLMSTCHSFTYEGFEAFFSPLCQLHYYNETESRFSISVRHDLERPFRVDVTHHPAPDLCRK